MRLGVSYNLFDGQELLEKSIDSIRTNVEFISVIFQKKSNFGNSSDFNFINFLENLKKIGKIDVYFEYKPNLNLPPHQNEINKRNIGIFLSQENNCTHHMSMDTDELYVSSEIEAAKNEMIKGEFDASFCQMLTYYKTGEYIVDPPEDYYVPLIYKLNNNSEFKYAHPCVVSVDPTRIIPSVNNKIFKRNEIQMHHLSMVRDNITSKLENSSSRKLFNDKIKDIINCYNSWEYPNDALWPGAQTKYVKIKKINNILT